MSGRQGTVLIVVAGIAAMLAAIMMTFIARVRSEADKSRLLVQEAQARIMLNAALSYIQETSRLGWGRETSGWTDVRDGALGPRGPVQSDGSLPAPAWWNNGSYGTYPPAPGFPDVGGVSAANLRWPVPGSAVRGDLFAWLRPPNAIELTYAYNPVPFDANMTNTALDRRTWLRNAYAAPGAKGALGPQPIAGNLTDFRSGALDTATGRPLVVPGSAGLGWFRIYREKPSDKNNDGSPWYDRVAFPAGNHSTFIITCGAGGARGFRFWDLPDANSRALEPVTARESGMFVDQAMFDDLLRDSRILWYRVEWSAATGANFDPTVYFDNGGQYRILSAQRLMSGGWQDGMPRQLNGANPINQVGTIKWIQRLEREPPAW